jgi:phage virion morphogenesis protein
MANIGVKITTQNQNALNELYERLRDPKPLLGSIGNALVNITSEAFQSETSPAGEAWQANKVTSRELKRSLAARMRNPEAERSALPNKKILHKSGQLALSISYIVKGVDEVVIGTNKKYAAIHQFGGFAGRGRRVKIPARPYLPMDAAGNLVKKAEDDISDIVQDYIQV